MSRKGFNFYRSYFDVAMELPDKDRLAFYDALAKKQFFGEEPILKGIAKLAYISQKHSIDAQVKGWEDKMGLSLQVIENQCNNNPCQGGSQGGDDGGCYAPSVQEKGKGKVKEEVKEKEEEEGKEDINIVSHETKIKNEAFEKFNKWVDENASNVRRIKNQITEEQFTKLKEKYNSQQIMQIILNLENYKDAPKKYTSVYLTVNNWIKNESSNKSYGERNTKVPASGSREAKEQSRRNLVKLADQILGIDESEDCGRSFR